MIKFLPFFGSLLLLFGSLARDLEALERDVPVGLEGAVNFALAHNPDWLAEQAKLSAQLSKVSEVGGWEAPKIKLQQAIKPVQTRNGSQDQVVSFSQKIPFPGQKGLSVEREQALYQVA